MRLLQCFIKAGALFELDFIEPLLTEQQFGRFAAALARLINIKGQSRRASDWQCRVTFRCSHLARLSLIANGLSVGRQLNFE